MVWFFVILRPMSLGLLPRVCAFGKPGQIKTNGYSGFENDVEDLVSDLPAAFVANDVPAAFCAPEVFVDAAMIASDCWFSMLGAALSALEDAAMLCFMKSIWNDDSGASGGRFTALMVSGPEPNSECCFSWLVLVDLPVSFPPMVVRVFVV